MSTFVMLLMWGSLFFGQSTAISFPGSLTLCNEAMAHKVADLQAAGLTVFSASCELQIAGSAEERKP
jgi:hypothetical protein